MCVIADATEPFLSTSVQQRSWRRRRGGGRWGVVGVKGGRLGSLKKQF